MVGTQVVVVVENAVAVDLEGVEGLAVAMEMEEEEGVVLEVGDMGVLVMVAMEEEAVVLGEVAMVVPAMQVEAISVVGVEDTVKEV